MPFQTKTTSREKSAWLRSGSAPYGAFSTRTSSSFSCDFTSETQPSPKLSQVSMSTPRAPSSDHIAISTAPVSDAGVMPMRQPSGIFSTVRVRSMTSARRALPSEERCDRPRSACDRTSGDQPGRFAQGPEEKFGSAGRVFGFIDLHQKRKPPAPIWRGRRKCGGYYEA